VKWSVYRPSDLTGDRGDDGDWVLHWPLTKAENLTFKVKVKAQPVIKDSESQEVRPRTKDNSTVDIDSRVDECSSEPLCPHPVTTLLYYNLLRFLEIERTDCCCSETESVTPQICSGRNRTEPRTQIRASHSWSLTPQTRDVRILKCCVRISPRILTTDLHPHSPHRLLAAAVCPIHLRLASCYHFTIL